MSRRSNAAHGQLLAVQAQVLYRHAEITSGAYKQRKLQQADSSQPSGYRDLTEEEKLEDSLSIMLRQVHRMTELSDFICEEVGREEREEQEDKDG